MISPSEALLQWRVSWKWLQRAARCSISWKSRSWGSRSRSRTRRRQRCGQSPELGFKGEDKLLAWFLVLDISNVGIQEQNRSSSYSSNIRSQKYLIQSLRRARIESIWRGAGSRSLRCPGRWERCWSRSGRRFSSSVFCTRSAQRDCCQSVQWSQLLCPMEHWISNAFALPCSEISRPWFETDLDRRGCTIWMRVAIRYSC